MKSRQKNSNNKQPNIKNYSIEELKGYRDALVSSLDKQCQLLDEIQNSDFIKDNDKTKILTKGKIDEFLHILKGEIKKLEHFDVVLAVVGTMKAGKSTTINAIIGREILPNRNRPMTALPTLIRHTPNQKDPLLSFKNPDLNKFIEQLKTLLEENPQWEKDPEIDSSTELKEIIKTIKANQFSFKEKYEGEKNIFEFLKSLNDLVRLSGILHSIVKEEYSNNKIIVEPEKVQFPYNEYRNIDQLPVIDIEFSHLENSEGRLILLDTPGPNEAGQEHLKTMMIEQLERSSAVLIILDYTQLKSEAEKGIRDELAQIPTIKKERLFALVNKFDQKNANSDNEEDTKDLIFNDLLKNRINNENIFTISSQRGFLANKMKHEIAKHNKKPELITDSWIEDFAKKAFGEEFNDDWLEASTTKIEKKANTMLEKSGINKAIEKAITQTHREAPTIAIKTTLAKIKNTIEEAITNFTEIHSKVIDLTEEELQAIKNSIEKLKTENEELKNLGRSAEDTLKKLREKEVLNVAKAITSLETEIKNHINKMFTASRDNLMSAHTCRTGFLQLEKTNKSIEELLKKYPGEIILSSSTAVNEFIKAINNYYDELVKKAKDIALENINTGTEKVKEEISIFEENCRLKFNSIQAEFKTNDINISLTLPTFNEFNHNAVKSISFTDPFKKEYETYKVESSGMMGTVKRGLGWLLGSIGMNNDLGYEEKTKEFFKTKKSDIQARMISDLNTIIYDIKKETANIFSAFSDNFIANYVDKVRELADSVILELEYAMLKQSKEENIKISYKDKINDFKIRNEQIKEDIDAIYNKFPTE
ncbi:dynamin family protein [uncultured Actinobacillus sp.]|uniref:dynamin family protein n=1 Tax=uncultured Actinobacillus sp. TaxID=417616 RepID=UPI0025DCCEB9|nr:dynamin family protein [uncultured Actinobacillus sp.]